MSEEQFASGGQAPQPNPPSDEEKYKRWIPFIIMGVVILGLLITVIVLLVNSSGHSAELEEMNTKIETVEDAKTEAERLYEDAKSQLERLQVENEDLYIRIADKEAQLEQQYAKISRLIRQAGAGKAAASDSPELEELRKEITKLKQIIASQGAEIEELKAENARLQAEKESLVGEVEATVAEKEALAADKEALKNENENLTEKVERAAVLRVTNIIGTGIRTRRNGQEREINRANRSDKIRICFDINRNEVVEPGNNRFLLQLTDPNNNVIQQSSAGGGRFEHAETGAEVRYTKSHNFNYAPNVESLCIDWTQNQGFRSGVYKVELFNGNYSAGSGTFELK